MGQAPPLELPRLPAAAAAVEYLRLWSAARRAPEAVAGDQRDRLRAMVIHARRHVPLYRDLYRGLSEDGMLELEQLPFIDKQTIVDCSRKARLAGPAPRHTRTLRTSGTTGEPASSDWPPGARWLQGVLTLRMASAQGLPPWHRRAMLVWDVDDRPRGGVFGHLRQRHAQLSAYQAPPALARALLDVRPDAVWAQSHLLIELGEWLPSSFRPRVVNTVGQELTSEDRAEVARIYGPDPLDVYSTSEQGVVAWQCAAADLYHINHEVVIVEVLDHDGNRVPPGGSGELVLTGLCNPLMPYLRYRIGDTATMASRPCRCGSTLPALERIDGRLSDWFIDEHNRRVAPHRLWISAHMDTGLELVHRYQIQQLPSRSVRIRLVPRVALSEDVLRALESSYRRLLGPGIPVEIEVVDRLAGERSRKFRTIMTTPAVDTRVSEECRVPGEPRSATLGEPAETQP